MAKAQKQVDLDSILSSAISSKEAKKSTSKIPLIKFDDEKVIAKVDKIRSLKEQMDSLQTELDLINSEMLKLVIPQREELCKENFSSSVKIIGSDNQTITYTWKDQYSKIDLENKEFLEVQVGEKQYDEYFATKLAIKVKDDIEESELKDLVKTLGAEKFKEYFNVDRWISPKTKYTQNFFSFSKQVREKLEEVVMQYKPALKTK